uniref:Uncharacterized protein n=1 Tax=Romanomermis culicivorax TaxID=13658 RepID=A0A915J1V8_ROMCU
MQPADAMQNATIPTVMKIKETSKTYDHAEVNFLLPSSSLVTKAQAPIKAKATPAT